jgi:hypothetical protein
MEFLWHVFNKYSWDIVGAGCFVARKKAEGFVEYGGGEFAYDHVLGRRGGSLDCGYPRERSVRVDTGVWREGGGFNFFHDGYDLCGVACYESRVGVSDCR